MYQSGKTISQILEAIARHDYVLPAIQRELVWQPEQICRFFDSLLQGYPFGTFLFWEIRPENSGKFMFYDFIRQYHERDNSHCRPLGEMHNRPLTAVLDGQQRLTALNIGFAGSAAWKLPYKRWQSSDAFPEKFLYLNLLSAMQKEEGEDGERYQFGFMTEQDASSRPPSECWFKVSEIMAMESGPAMLAWLHQQHDQLGHKQQQSAFEVLDRLHRITKKEGIVSYFEETSQEIDRVLHIFIRTNSGGTVLSYSDLLFSMAVSQWKVDARQEIHTLVDEINKTGGGFSFSKDLVLKAGLMLSDIGSVGFKVENFNRKNMDVLENNWTQIKRALRLTVDLVSSFGFNGQTLRANSAILPVAYYLHKLNPGENYATHSKFEADRQEVRKWLVHSLLASGIWGSGLDTLLTALREVIREHGREKFPAQKMRKKMAHRGKRLAFGPDEVEELTDMKYGDKRLFALLSLLFPFVDLKNQFHIDHFFPKSRFTNAKLDKAGIEDVDNYSDWCNRIANLQLLDGPANLEKREKLPSEWLKKQFPNEVSRKDYIEKHCLGEVPKAMDGFGEFYQARRDMLKGCITKLLSQE